MGEVMELGGAGLTLSQGTFGYRILGLFLVGTGAHEPGRFGDGKGFDRREVAPCGLGLLLPPEGARLCAAARLPCPKHPVAEVRMFLRLPGSEVLLCSPCLVCPFLCLGHARVGVGCLLRDRDRPVLEFLGRLRRAGPTMLCVRLDGAVFLGGRGMRADGSAFAEPAGRAAGIRRLPHPSQYGEVGAPVGGGLLDDRATASADVRRRGDS